MGCRMRGVLFLCLGARALAWTAVGPARWAAPGPLNAREPNARARTVLQMGYVEQMRQAAAARGASPPAPPAARPAAPAAAAFAPAPQAVEPTVEEIDFASSSIEEDMSLVLELIGQRQKQPRPLSRAQVDQYERAAESIIGKLGSATERFS